MAYRLNEYPSTMAFNFVCGQHVFQCYYGFLFVRVTIRACFNLFAQLTSAREIWTPYGIICFCHLILFVCCVLCVHPGVIGSSVVWFRAEFDLTINIIIIQFLLNQAPDWLKCYIRRIEMKSVLPNSISRIGFFWIFQKWALQNKNLHTAGYTTSSVKYFC